MRTNSIILDSFNVILVENFLYFFDRIEGGFLGDEGILDGKFDDF
jgi:hypothetical protein